MSSDLGWISVCAAAAAVVATYAGSLAQTPAPSDGAAESPMVDITREELGGLLARAGYTFRANAVDSWTVNTPTNQVLSVQLLDCSVGRCPAVRIGGHWQMGDREAAIGAARTYEETEYLADVSMDRDAEQTVLFVSRVIWLSAGRTPRNLLSQVDQVDGAITTVTELLRRKDRGIVEFWRELEAVGDE